jgi:hypothetical protein
MTNMTEAEGKLALAELFDEPEYGEYAWLLPGIKTQSAEHVVELCREIQQEHAAKCLDGVVVDAWTAAAIVTVADGLNERNRAKFMLRRTVVSMGKLAQELCFREKQRSPHSGDSKS